MQIIDGIPVFGPPDPGALAQIKTCAKTATFTALMADHHKGYAVPIGGVVAYENAISPSGVGFDIGCGNKAVLTNANADDVRKNINTIMDDIVRKISFGMGRVNEHRMVGGVNVTDHDLFYDDPAWKLPGVAPLKELGRSQLGTVGSGNHYVDIFEDELKRIWIGVHFGSRGLGHKIATYFLKKAGAKDGMDVEPCVLDATSSLGADYIAAMRLAGRYAYAGRDWVCDVIAKYILGSNVIEEVHNHHNFAWEEKINGVSMWVVRKGATPAYPGQKGFVGGTMGEDSVILEGTEEQEMLDGRSASMNSTVHGAGRVMSRTDAKGKYNRKTGVLIRPGRVKPEDMLDWLGADIVLRGGGLDESPDCYKRLNEVLAHQGPSVRVLHTLTPLGVAMAGENEFDPYKD